MKKKAPKKNTNKKRLNSGGADDGDGSQKPKVRKAGKAIDSDDDLGQDAKVTAAELDLDRLKAQAEEEEELQDEEGAAEVQKNWPCGSVPLG